MRPEQRDQTRASCSAVFGRRRGGAARQQVARNGDGMHRADPVTAYGDVATRVPGLWAGLTTMTHDAEVIT
ncbi:hypothetical protein AB0C34_15425 [Nocardia sp. NPDC049220]|uniref:hypothetical protein n=1 Tax=Nocardia sp. NPDC049220 TaxID=3155273 RepID=UPI0033D5AE94